MKSKIKKMSVISKSLKGWGALLITILSFVVQCIYLNKNGNEPTNESFWLLLGGSTLLIVAIISTWANYSKKKCSSSFFPGGGNKKIKIIIQEGDVLKQDGIKVIHVQDTFETSIEKSIEHSLLYAFLSSKEVRKDKNNLNISIQKSLQSNGYSPKEVESPLNEKLSAANMKTSKYEIGAVAEYKQFQLVAFSTIIDVIGNVDKKNMKKYKSDVNKVFMGLQKAHKGNVINKTYNVGVWGYINNGKMYDTRKRIEIMVKSFIKNSQNDPFCDTLRICLLSEHVKKMDFDIFSEMQILLDYLVENPE